jgi:hypothetical protein
LREPVRSALRYQRPAAPSKIDAHVEWLHRALEADAHRARRDRRTAREQLERFAADAVFGYGSLLLKQKFLAELRMRDRPALR